MKKILSPLVLLLIGTPAFLLAGFAYPPTLPDAESFTYKKVGGTELNLYAFKPKGWKASDKRSAVVFFFGGGWKAGSPEQFAEQCKYLAKRGMVAITADYRVSSRNHTTALDCVNDARDAVRWTRSHAAELGIDPNRIAAGGGSAGGHIAACLGTIAPDKKEKISSRPDAMFLFNPACVLAPMEGVPPRSPDVQESLRQRLGVEHAEDLSPAHHVTGNAPPCILFHGKSDTTVPFVTAKVFAQKMKQAGVRCDLKGFEGEAHGFFNYGRNGNRPFKKSMEQLNEFLVSLGWIKK